MASSLDIDVGRAPSKSAVIKVLTIDLTAVASYATGGHAITELTAALDDLVEGSTAHAVSVGQESHDGSASRYFKVDVANKKIQSFTTASYGTETTATDDLSSYTAVPVLLIGEG